MYKKSQGAKWKPGVNWRTCTGCPPCPSYGGRGSGGSPTLQEGTGGWQGAPSWPHIQAASYLLCYHLASSSPSTAGSKNSRGCFPQGTNSVGKLSRAGSGLYSSTILGALETNGTRTLPGAGCRVSHHGERPPPRQAGLGDAILCSVVLVAWMSPRVSGRATPARRRFRTTTVTLSGAEGPPEGPSHPQSPVQQQMCSVTCGWLCQPGRDPME